MLGGHADALPNPAATAASSGAATAGV